MTIVLGVELSARLDRFVEREAGERDAIVRDMIARCLDEAERDSVAVQPRRNGRPRRDLDLERIRRLHASGASVRSIADAMGVPKSTIATAITSMAK